MPERNLQTQDHVNRQASPTTAWSYEDQQQALLEGFNSVAEWGLFHAVRKLEALEERVHVLENQMDAALEGKDTVQPWDGDE